MIRLRLGVAKLSGANMKFRLRGFRAMVLGLCVAAGLLLAPAAFARTHVGVGISLPGVSVGYWGGGHGHWGGRGFVGVGFGGYYGPYYGYGPGYYAAPAYYGPVYYGHCYARPFYDARGYYHPGYSYSC
jgi:hypothetical protein